MVVGIGELREGGIQLNGGAAAVELGAAEVLEPAVGALDAIEPVQPAGGVAGGDRRRAVQSRECAIDEDISRVWRATEAEQRGVAAEQRGVAHAGAAVVGLEARQPAAAPGVL